ncbi:hypothetical protein RJ641_031389 [Dillenia turbinata]|uniref:Uncharacterized protein n=1 Tax=Dillenia turbinata TaxID=194707 RepID=A0AAN8VXF8_9MAGN
MLTLSVDSPHAEETEQVAPAVEQKSTEKSKDFDLSESEEEKNEPMEENIESNEEKLEDKPAGLGKILGETEGFAEFPEDDDFKEKDNVDLHVEEDDDDDD